MQNDTNQVQEHNDCALPEYFTCNISVTNPSFVHYTATLLSPVHQIMVLKSWELLVLPPSLYLGVWCEDSLPESVALFLQSITSEERKPGLDLDLDSRARFEYLSWEWSQEPDPAVVDRRGVVRFFTRVIAFQRKVSYIQWRMQQCLFIFSPGCTVAQSRRLGYAEVPNY